MLAGCFLPLFGETEGASPCTRGPTDRWPGGRSLPEDQSKCGERQRGLVSGRPAPPRSCPAAWAGEVRPTVYTSYLDSGQLSQSLRAPLCSGGDRQGCGSLIPSSRLAVWAPKGYSGEGPRGIPREAKSHQVNLFGALRSQQSHSGWQDGKGGRNSQDPNIELTCSLSSSLCPTPQFPRQHSLREGRG